MLSNYGLALSDHAMVAEPAESKVHTFPCRAPACPPQGFGPVYESFDPVCQDLFARSYEKYRLAASLKPDNVLTQCNLAMYPTQQRPPPPITSFPRLLTTFAS